MSDLYKNIQETVQNGNYAIRSHTVSHMLAEGFGEDDILEAIGNGKLLELYNEEDRCLITGTFQLSENTKEHLHLVIDFWSEIGEIEWIDIVTAYIPRRPFWETPNIRGKKR